ncbi:MarR family winged helix-turn-helix transcriptional regulator [Humibacter ginsenosidimutans]|uniref:Winged helix-turn-helix transcriptional regulator n=1 Tax=Humibacter ginsenosidimutans TaxID=2599293 RepID=A0A5B8M0Z9_9MICO|nr:MarR family winged helix-turn-helix transcriptional regulator [Humibacter ginsenosidimutans]QDZ14347.1 winged helix-turn-helix transcriptional regulator [Humibacter ginsenosidimutans]
MTHRFDDEIPLLLIGSFRAVVDELHDHLRDAGLGESRALHGFALKAIDDDGVSISELARRLGVTKQAAARTAQSMESAGLVERRADPSDSRATVITRTAHADAVLDEGERFYRRKEEQWRAQLGDERYEALRDGLRELAGSEPVTSIPGWLGRATRA